MMTVARSVADVLADHVVFEVECIDRMYLNVYVPQLQYAAGLVGFVHRQLGLPIASTAPISDAGPLWSWPWSVARLMRWLCARYLLITLG